MTRQIVFVASIVFALIFAAIPARAASRCYPLCSPSLEISMGYVQPTGLEQVGGETFSSPGQVTVNGTYDLRLTPGRGLIIPILGGTIGFPVGPSPTAFSGIDGKTISISKLMYGAILLPGFGLSKNNFSFLVRGAFAGMEQNIEVGGNSDQNGSQLLGFGAVEDASLCPALRHSSGPSLRICVFAQSAFFEHAEVVASGLRLTTF